MMLSKNQTRWTDDRVEALVTPQFVLEQFQPEHRTLLKRTPTRTAPRTYATYLDYIGDRAKRLFLILQHIGIPEHIFTLVDASYDDTLLPIPDGTLDQLKLPHSTAGPLETKFYRAQFIYLIRDIKEGDHQRFLEDEVVPIRSAGSNSTLGRSKDPVEKVHLTSDPARTYGRKKIALDQRPNHLTEAEVRAEIAAARQLANEHVLSLYASYTYKKDVYILLRPAMELTLNSFLEKSPKHFESLSKPQRREILVNWPHCLAHGLAWLHSQGRAHGAIRPSNILLDGEYHIFLGQVDGLVLTQGANKVSDLESYHYAAPERWQRAATFQKKTPTSLTLHSGGRTAHKHNLQRPTPPPSIHDDHPDGQDPSGQLSPDLSQPVHTNSAFLPTSKPGSTRRSPKRQGSSDYASSIRSSSSNGAASRRPGSKGGASVHSASYHGRPPPLPSHGQQQQQQQQQQGHSQSAPTSIILAPSEVRTTVVQTWQSSQFDPLAADMFSFGAIVVDIMNRIGKRSPAAFAKYRSAKNRTGGRGGGVLDASFHSNLGQVCAWTESLEEDARKKAAKENLKILEAVPTTLAMARQCLSRSPHERPSSRAVERTLERCIQECTTYAMAHCRFQPPQRVVSPAAAPAADPTGSSAVLPPNLGSPAGGRHGPSTPDERAEAGNSQTHGMHKISNPHEELGQFDFGYHDTVATSKQHSMKTTDGIKTDVSSSPSVEQPGWKDRSAKRKDHHWLPVRSRPDSISEEDEEDDDDADYDDDDDDAAAVGDAEAKQRWSTEWTSHEESATRANSSGPLPGLPNSSHQSLNHSYPSSTAAKRASVGTSRSRGTAAARGGDHRDPGEMAGMVGPSSRSDEATGRKMSPALAREAGMNNTTSRQRYGIVEPEDQPNGEADNDIGSDEKRRGRNSVSTLASNSSTIRLSWRQRDVSPVSLHDQMGNSGASICATPSTDRIESVPVAATDASSRSRQTSDPRDAGGGDFRKMVGLARMERLYRNVKQNEVTIRAPNATGSEAKGKRKPAETTSPKKGGLASRYSILSGRV